MTTPEQRKWRGDPVAGMKDYAPPCNPAGLKLGPASPTKPQPAGLPEASRQTPINDELGNEYREKHMVKKLLLIVVMLLVICQLVWVMG